MNHYEDEPPFKYEFLKCVCAKAKYGMYNEFQKSFLITLILENRGDLFYEKKND